MAAPFNNLRSKLNRAVVAHLITAGAGGSDSIFPFLSATTKDISDNKINTTVRARVGRPRIEFSGNYDIVLQITVRGSAVQAVDDISEIARLEFDNRVALVYDAMMQTEDGQTLDYTAQLITDAGRALAVDDPTNNADMDDFTCLSLKDGGFGDPNPNEQECVLEEVLMFEVCCCGSNVGGYSASD